MLIVEDLFLFINQDVEIEISAVYPKIENVSVQFIHCLYIRMGNNDTVWSKVIWGCRWIILKPVWHAANNERNQIMISSICWSHWLFLFVMNTTHLSELGYPKFCTVVLDLALLLLLKTLGSCITLKIVWIVHFHFINWDTQGRNKSLWWARYCFPRPETI